ncbi:Imm51 family immunity protein [Actinomyces sp.]|uniref:Imm51 family immunity protein n=1 Tax=Actinomyces sp. TaxID=29317 RepID=UPI0026DAD575|nr:Imm51 family immunity protein [Actinomyces sp.]MDO4899998.1 Imm51 family immunity protein [Actinomyces sp.]
MAPSDAAASLQLPGYLRLRNLPEFNQWSLHFDVGGPRTAERVAELGHEPNGYFWAGVVQRLVELGELPEVETDPEGDTFSAYGTRTLMERLSQALVPYLTDPGALTALVTAADADGFDFDD